VQNNAACVFLIALLSSGCCGVEGAQLRTPESCTNPVMLTAISKGMQTVTLCFNRILHVFTRVAVQQCLTSTLAVELLSMLFVKIIVSKVASTPDEVAMYAECTLLAASLTASNEGSSSKLCAVKACVEYLRENEFVAQQTATGSGDLFGLCFCNILWLFFATYVCVTQMVMASVKQNNEIFM